MTDLLRIYDPAECDEYGVPLDWEQCRTCGGTGQIGIAMGYATTTCAYCEGYGSLKAAALVSRLAGVELEEPIGGVPHLRADALPRCEGCAHPMSEGTWERRTASDIRALEVYERVALEALREGLPARSLAVTHYSPCDEDCKHDGPIRWPGATREWAWHDPALHSPIKRHELMQIPGREASWRSVNVRCLSWAHDLRSEKLAVLCLRCWAERTAT